MKIFEMFQEDNGGVSFIRVISFLIVTSILFCYVYVTIKTGVMQVLELGSVVVLLGSPLSKVMQKGKEQNVPVEPIVKS